MIMRITWGKLRPGSWNEFEKTYNATVAAKGRSLKGLRGRWLLQDAQDKDTGFAVSLWDSSADMQAYEQSNLYRQEFAPALHVLRRGLQDVSLRRQIYAVGRKPRPPERAVATA